MRLLDVVVLVGFADIVVDVVGSAEYAPSTTLSAKPFMPYQNPAVFTNVSACCIRSVWQEQKEMSQRNYKKATTCRRRGRRNSWHTFRDEFRLCVTRRFVCTTKGLLKCGLAKHSCNANLGLSKE